MSEKSDSKFTPHSAEAALKGAVKIVGKVITVNKNGRGLKKLAALDYLEKNCGAIIKFERAPAHTNSIPLELRGVMK
jgi:hypothetical protein